MPYISHNNTTLHYKIEPGSKPALLLMHGYSFSGRSWYSSAYVDFLKQHYTVIVPDLPAHGDSSVSHQIADYSNKELVSSLVALLDELAVEQAIYWGYSLGAIIGFSTALIAPERFSAWILGGEQPYGTLDDWPASYIPALARGMPAYIKFLEARLKMTLPDKRRQQLLAQDPQALIAMLTACTYYFNQPQALEALNNQDKPVLFYCGEQDLNHQAAQKASKTVTQSKFISLPKFDHGLGFRDSETVLHYIFPFLQQM